MKQLFSSVFCLMIGLSVSTGLQAREVKGVNFPEEIKVGDTTLKLNGVGIRTAKMIIQVYVGGLYVATPSTDPEVLVAATTPKVIDMHFLMSVDKGNLKEGWETGFKNNAGAYKFKEDLDKFMSFIPNMKKGNRVYLTIHQDKVDVQVNNGEVNTVQGADFAKTMLKIYIMKLDDTKLKNGLLGIKK